MPTLNHLDVSEFVAGVFSSLFLLLAILNKFSRPGTVRTEDGATLGHLLTNLWDGNVMESHVRSSDDRDGFKIPKM